MKYSYEDDPGRQKNRKEGAAIWQGRIKMIRFSRAKQGHLQRIYL